MIRTFVEVPSFTKRWSDLGFDDDDLMERQKMLLKNPEAGDIMQGTGGLRKVRFAFEGRGKSGSVRVCYVDFEEYTVIYLITAYAKKEKDNLTDKEKAVLKVLVKQLKEEAAERRKG
ncbi:MAG: type II toxin-antitoxin system RelE/ParE family toxin [Candidatus Avilachnospira sp.]|jgi:hypothetical protein